jgi:hypothetical protein
VAQGGLMLSHGLAAVSERRSLVSVGFDLSVVYDSKDQLHRKACPVVDPHDNIETVCIVEWLMKHVCSFS